MIWGGLCRLGGGSHGPGRGGAVEPTDVDSLVCHDASSDPAEFGKWVRDGVGEARVMEAGMRPRPEQAGSDRCG